MPDVLWLSRDPIGEEGGLNLYGYVENDPINGTDPLGLLTAVIVGGATPGSPGNSTGNPFGHIAIAMTGKGVFSFGTGTDPGSSLTAYLNGQGKYRNSEIYILNTTPEQEQAMLDWLKKQSPNINKWPDNCASRVNGALEAGGVRLYKPEGPGGGRPGQFCYTPQ